MMKIVFTRRPIPIPPDYRPMYKIAQILLVLKLCSYGEKATLMKIQLFSWALRSKRNMDLVLAHLAFPKEKSLSFWGIEPSINRALRLAVAENLIRMVKDKYVLTKAGERFTNKILSEMDIMDSEKTFLLSVGKKISEKHISEIVKSWSF